MSKNINATHESEFEYEFNGGYETPKKFVVFEAAEPYPMGGLHDIINSFDDIDEAKAFAISHHESCQIVDRDTWLFVEDKYY